MNLFYSLCAKVHITKMDAKMWAKDHSPFLIGLFLLLFASVGHAESISDILDNGSALITDLVNFIIDVAVIMGVGAILYGLKLIYDKSNDRENVKNAHIVFSFVGGAGLVLLWFIVQALAESMGDGTIGEESDW